MLHVRFIKRARRRWSIAHEMDGPSTALSSTAIEVPSPGPLQRNPSVSNPTPRWSLPQSREQPAATPEQRRLSRRRRPRSLRVPRISHSSAIVSSPELVAPLQSHFPVRYHACDWQAVYSTMRDGVSLQTFYAKCAGPDPIVLIVRDGGKAVFGCYTSVPWKAAKQYYGNGEGFVFSLQPQYAVYKWSRANSFFQLGTGDFMAIGGGGKFALRLDSMFERGSSGPCATFSSPCLALSDQFDVVVLEAYKLVSPLKLTMEEKDT